MKESNFLKNIDITNHHDRRNVTLDRMFTYNHFQIGSNYINLNDFMKEKNNNVGFATIGGLRVGNLLYYAVSLCSPIDNFSRYMGRQFVNQNMKVDSSKKRGILDISKLADEPPPVVLKYALEHYLKKTRRLPIWTKQQVFFKGTPRKERCQPTI